MQQYYSHKDYKKNATVEYYIQGRIQNTHTHTFLRQHCPRTHDTRLLLMVLQRVGQRILACLTRGYASGILPLGYFLLFSSRCFVEQDYNTKKC